MKDNEPIDTSTPGDKSHLRLLLSVGEAAQMLNISTSHAWTLVRRGKLPSLRLGHRVLIPYAKVLAIVESDVAYETG